jgi:hypothetical protein
MASLRSRVIASALLLVVAAGWGPIIADAIVAEPCSSSMHRSSGTWKLVRCAFSRKRGSLNNLAGIYS